MALFQATDITRRFAGVVAVDGVSLQVDEGEILGLMGPNGSGKTTFINCVSGVDQANSGRVMFDGSDITKMKPFRVAERGIGRTFQNLRLFENMTTTENVMCGGHLRQNTGLIGALLPSRSRQQRNAEERERAVALLREVGLEDRIDQYATDLSYGQTKRLELARALNIEPRLLLLDEPTAGMNDRQAAEILGLVRRIQRDRGIAMIVIEHNVPALVWLADRIAVLEAGQVLVEDEPEIVARHPDVIRAYLGEEALEE